MLISKQLYDIAMESGLLDEYDGGDSEEIKLASIDRFAKNIVDLCVNLIEDEYIKGDLSERANGIRIARNAIIRGIE